MDGPEVRALLNDEEKLLQLKNRLQALYPGMQSIPMDRLLPKLEDMLERVL